MGMSAAYLTPGATATVTAGVSSPSPTVTSSDPSVVAVPTGATSLTATLATFVVTGLTPGTSLISVQGNIHPLLVTVVAAGTQPRWPGAVAMGGNFSVLPLDQPLIVTVIPSGTAPFTAAKATGTVSVTSGGTELARRTISGTNTVTFPVYMQALGANPYVITYSGDSNFLPQTVNASVFVNPGRVGSPAGSNALPARRERTR